MARSLTTRLIRVAAARAAEPTGLQFTRGQLYYELCRLATPAHLVPRQVSFTVPPVVPYALFERLLADAGRIDGLLGDPEPVPEPGRLTVETDLFDYALPRLLICQSAAVAHMLRANGLPMESACAVLSADDLPLHPGLARMLDATAATEDGARVYVLHDDSPEGLTLPDRLRTDAGLPESAIIVPIGLRRSQTRPLHLVRTGPAPSAPVDVESVPPAVLLRSVHRLVRDVHRYREPVIGLRAAQTTGFLTWPRG